jgi:mannose-6-phosphate isomerase-like protein (cupin superfamily)
MRTTRIEEGTVVMSDDNFTGRRLYASPKAVVVHMTVNPGRAVEPHTSDMDMEFFVLEGEALFTVGDEELAVGPGVLVEGPKGMAHGMRNPGSLPLKVLAIRNP